ncbi:hypothetical protein BDR22DRAFT_974797 [Usnea florida]
MASTMTEVLVVLVFMSIPLLSACFDLFLMFIFTRPSTQEGRDYLTAVEDMVLPMGSFPSRLLIPWWSTPNPYNSNPLPPNSNSEPKQEAVPAPDEPIHIQDRKNKLPTMSFSPLTTIEIEPVVDATPPTVIDKLAEFHVFENEIRGLIDPEGVYPPQSKATRDLVADMVTEHKEDVKNMENKRAEEKRKFEQDIEGHETRYHDLCLQYEVLSAQNVREEEKSRGLGSRNDCLRVQIEEKIHIKDDAEKRADAAEKRADAAEQRAEDGVQRRLDELRNDLEEKNKVAEDKIKQDRDSVILSKSKIESELEDARRKVGLLKKKQKSRADEFTGILDDYKMQLRQRDSVATTSEKRAERAERELEEFRNEKLKNDSVEVTNLRKELRASKDLAKSLEPFKRKSENHERIYQRMKENRKNLTTEIRENKDHIINRLESEKRSLQSTVDDMEARIEKQRRQITKLKSGKELEELKSELEQAKKQLEDAQLDTENLRREFRTRTATSEQEAEDVLMKTRTQLEKDKTIAVNKATRQAEMVAAGKVKEKEAEHEKRIKLAVDNVLNATAVEAGKKEQQYVDMREALVDDVKKNAAGEAAMREQQYEMAKRAAVEDAVRKAVAETESKLAAQNAAAEVEKQAARETEMDIAPDPEVNSLLRLGTEIALLKDQHEKKVEDAVNKALQNAQQLHQKEMADQVQNAVQDAKIHHEKEKNDLIAAKEAAEAAQQAQEAPRKVTQTKSSDVADRQTSSNPINLTLAAMEAEEASKLLEEIVRDGVAVDTVEHTVLRRLHEIRTALNNIKVTLQIPFAPTEKKHYQDMLRGFRLEESVLERLDSEPKHKSLVRLGRLANERLRTVTEILETSGVQKNAILQALVGPKRQVAPIRGLKRPMQSKKPRVDNGQSSAEAPPTPSAKPNADNHQSFESIMRSLHYC